MRVIASIEARMGSTRLPDKMTADIAGKATLVRVIERLRQAQSLDGIVLATSTNTADKVLVELADQENISVFRGSEEDVLGRVVCSHVMMNSDIVVEICGDCPLIDPVLVDLAVDTFLANDCDVAACGAKQSYPQGTEVQVFSLETLSTVAKTIFDPSVREHVALYLHENPEIYRIIHLTAPRALQSPEIRLQLDYEEDLQLLREIYKALLPEYNESFGVPEILTLLQKRPELKEINAHCEERAVR